MNLNETAFNAELQQLLDRNEITDLVYRLGFCLDEGLFDDLRSLFVEEATVWTGGGRAEGRDGLVAQAARNHRPEDRIQHITTNLIIDLDGDRAKVRANLLVHFASGAGTNESRLPPTVDLTLGEVYRFDFVRTTQGWRFSRVEAVPVWMFGSPDRILAA
jgi:hypothetical protein